MLVHWWLCTSQSNRVECFPFLNFYIFWIYLNLSFGHIKPNVLHHICQLTSRYETVTILEMMKTSLKSESEFLLISQHVKNNSPCKKISQFLLISHHVKNLKGLSYLVIRTKLVIFPSNDEEFIISRWKIKTNQHLLIFVDLCIISRKFGKMKNPVWPTSTSTAISCNILVMVMIMLIKLMKTVLMIMLTMIYEDEHRDIRCTGILSNMS